MLWDLQGLVLDFVCFLSLVVIEGQWPLRFCSGRSVRELNGVFASRFPLP